MRKTIDSLRETIAFLGIGMAIFLGLSGQIVSFAPFAAAIWFDLAAAFAALGMLSLRLKVKRVAVVLFIGLVFVTCYAYIFDARKRGMF